MADQPNQQQMNINANPEKTPIVYTDNIFMTTNNFGVVLDIGQRLASTNQIQVVTRVGMSREHAKKFVEELGKLIAMTEGQVQTSGKSKN
jgi:hypothetical protein